MAGRGEASSSLNASSTHDTKRSEDVRFRLDALTEIAEEWVESVERWRHLNAPHAGTVDGEPVPGPNTESGIYQALVGTWLGEPPDDVYRQRIGEYVVKAARERSLRTSWQDTDQVYERALRSFVTAILDPARSPDFLDEIAEFSRRIAVLGALSGLTATLLKMTCPGIPDFYQGHETEVLSLVDPDNRRPIDFGERMASLDALPDGLLDAAWWWRALADGRAKQAIVKRTLAVRRQMPELFRAGTYVPLPVRGARHNAVVAFARKHPTGEVWVIAPRHWHAIVSDRALVPAMWGNTEVDFPGQGAFRDAISGRSIEVDGPVKLRDLLAEAPVAILLYRASS
jgi:(1->4)-alpha-D-glucan 1-alpha-D-glucosylmutase